MKVRDIMTTGLETASPDTSLQEIAMMMKREDVGAIPILDGDELTGIITDRDIVVRCIAAGKAPSDTRADDILSGDLETVGPDDDVEEASRIMAERQIRRLPVCDDGYLVGMISLGDVAVKESEDIAGEALEDISAGVKDGDRSGARNKQPVWQAGAQAGGSRKKVQAIGNRALGGGTERRQRANPQRAAGSGGRKRRKAS